MITLNHYSAQFISWLQQHPRATINPKIDIVGLSNRGTGKGIVANKVIDESEEICSIPFETVLRADTSELHQHFSGDLDSLDTWLSLTFVLLYESGKGHTSSWWPYLLILPHQFDTLIYWSKSEIAELQGSTVAAKIGKEDADKAFLEELMPLAIKHAELFGEYSSWLKEPNAQDRFLPLAHRMASLVMAYAFDLEKEERIENADEDGFLSDDEHDPPKGMVPLADIFRADAGKTNARLFHSDTSLTMTAVQCIRKGEEIFNDCGPLPRSDLLRRYGYIVDSHKEWDIVEIETMTILKIVRMVNDLDNTEIDQRARLAQRWDVWEDSFDLTRQSGNELLPHNGFEPSFILTLAVLATKRADLQGLLAIKRAPKPSMNLEVTSLLQEVIRYRQKEYCTSIAEDVNLLQQPAVQGRHRLAIEIRLGEKEILASTLLYAKKKMEKEADIASSKTSTTSLGNQSAKRGKIKR